MPEGHCDVCERKADQIHNFPQSLDRALQWAKSMDWEWEFKSYEGIKLAASITICSKHFEEKCYLQDDKRNRLRPGSIPTLGKRRAERKDRVPTTGDHDYLNATHPHRGTAETPVASVMSSGGVRKKPERTEFMSTQESDDTVPNLSRNPSNNTEDFLFQDTMYDRKKRRAAEKDEMEQLQMKYSLLSNESLLELQNYVPGCFKCHNTQAVRKFKRTGGTLIVHIDCPHCKKWSWGSTPPVQDDSLGSIVEGNMDMVSATFLSGIPYERATDMHKVLELGFPGRETYYQIIKKHAKPVIDGAFIENVAEIRKRMEDRGRAASRQTRKTVHQKMPLSLIGDAQFDSRGFCAMICRYVFMDYDTRFVIGYNIQMRKENGGNSPIMESKAFAFLMEQMSSDPTFTVAQITTDKHTSVVSHMRKAYPQVPHKLDKWHIIKGFKKNNTPTIDKVRNVHLRAHWNHILIHLWVSIECANGNADLAVELIRSCEYHLQDIHNLPQDTFRILKRCAHGPLTSRQDKPNYLNPTIHAEQIKALHNMLNNESFLENIRCCASKETTSPIESFHSLAALIYLPKNYYFGKSSTDTRMKLAILHHNNNRIEITDRVAAGIDPPVRRKYSKSQKRYRQIINQPRPSTLWKEDIVEKIKRHYRQSKTAMQTNRLLGRPARPVDTEPDSDTDEGDDVGLDDEPEDEHSLDDDDESEDDILPLPTNTQPLSSITHNLPVIRVGLRQYPQAYERLGTDADLYEFRNIRTGELILPFNR